MTQTQNIERFGLDIEILEEDKLSYRVMRVRHQGQAMADFDALNQKADALVNSLTYLEDPLRLVEQDQQQAVILLRSETPRQLENGVEYYEVRLNQDGLTEIGYQHYARDQTDLSPKDMVMSHRQLERLGQDLAKVSSSKI